MQKTLSNAKNFWKYIFGVSKRVSFSYFPKDANNHGRCPLISFYKFHGSRYNIQYKVYVTPKMEFFVTKKGNSWKLLFTVVIESFVLNVAGLLDPALKDIDKFRLNQTLTFQKKLFYFLQ